MKFCLLLLDFKIHHTSTVFNKSTAIKNGLLYIQPLIRVIGYLKRSTSVSYTHLTLPTILRV